MRTCMKVVFALGFCSSILGVAPAALAHHSFAMFDQTKLLHTSGVVVTKFLWTNPHSYVVVDAPSPKGPVSYTLECSSPNLMSHQGWKFNTVKVGDKVNIAFYPLRTGKPGGMLRRITLPSGKTLSAW